jgi:hypothetical protein
MLRFWRYLGCCLVFGRFVERDLPGRKVAFFAEYFYILGCAQDTHVRQNASELAFALAYSYL